MASNSKELIPDLPEHDNPFSDRLDKMIISPKQNKKIIISNDEESSIQPKDYAKKNCNLASNQKVKVVNESN